MKGTYKVGFTGTRKGMTPKQERVLSKELEQIVVYSCKIVRLEFHHGNCEGSDEQAAAIARDLGYWTVAHPPVDQKNMSNFKSDETREPKEFLDRNHDIVDECDELIATPKEHKEVLRSGTWATIRYAQKQHKILRKLLP